MEDKYHEIANRQLLFSTSLLIVLFATIVALAALANPLWGGLLLLTIAYAYFHFAILCSRNIPYCYLKLSNIDNQADLESKKNRALVSCRFGAAAAVSSPLALIPLVLLSSFPPASAVFAGLLLAIGISIGITLLLTALSVAIQPKDASVVLSHEPLILGKFGEIIEPEQQQQHSLKSVEVSSNTAESPKAGSSTLTAIEQLEQIKASSGKNSNRHFLEILLNANESDFDTYLGLIKQLTQSQQDEILTLFLDSGQQQMMTVKQLTKNYNTLANPDSKEETIQLEITGRDGTIETLEVVRKPSEEGSHNHPSG